MKAKYIIFVPVLALSLKTAFALSPPPQLFVENPSATNPVIHCGSSISDPTLNSPNVSSQNFQVSANIFV